MVKRGPVVPVIFFLFSLRFVLSSTESSSGAEPIIHYSGLATEAVASALKPFTQYAAVLEASEADAYLLFCTSLQ